VKKLSLLVVLIITLKTAQFVKAQETAAEPVAVKNFFTSTDDLLSRNGLTAQFSQTTDASVHLQGQDKFSNPRMRHLLKFSLTLQSKQLGWQDGRFFAVAHSHGGRDGAIYADTFQGISNIDSSNRTHLYEMWFEQNLFGKKMRIKAGKVDANTEFAFVENALDFINPSMGFSPTIVGFPTFPDGHPSLNVFAYPGHGTYAGLG